MPSVGLVVRSTFRSEYVYPMAERSRLLTGLLPPHLAYSLASGSIVRRVSCLRLRLSVCLFSSAMKASHLAKRESSPCLDLKSSLRSPALAVACMWSGERSASMPRCTGW